MRLFLILMLTIMCLIPSVGGSSVPPQSQIIYVNRCNGVPLGAPGAGSQTNPYSTLTAAAEGAPAGSTLVVQANIYAESPTIRKHLAVVAQGGEVRVVGQPASTQKVCQLTGEVDLERQQFTSSRTETNFALKGTDLGAAVEHNGRIYFLFGDTHPVGPFIPRPYDPNEPRPHDGDSIAWIPANADPEQCLALNFIGVAVPNFGNAYISPRVRKADGTFISLGGFEVPTGGFSANGNMYVFFTTDFQRVGNIERMGRTVLARLDNESQNLFTYIYDVSCRPGVGCDWPQVGSFINVAPVVVNNADVPGLPQGIGQGVLMFSSGLYRNSDVYLAYLPFVAIESRQAWRYAVTDGAGTLVRWSQDESEATPLFNQPCGGSTPCMIGELSVTWNPYLRKWLMLYGHGNPWGINYRVADRPWGPWSPPNLLFSAVCDRGNCHFMHVDWDFRNCDSVYDSMFGSSRQGEGAGEYGPYVISRFTRGDATSTTIYYLMSTWNPYQVVLMKSTLQLYCACRPN
jgi:hypothetical protein